MAVILIEGFDNGILAEKNWTRTGSTNGSSVTTGGRLGGKCVLLPNGAGTSQVHKNFVGATELYIGIAYYCQTPVVARTGILRLRSAALGDIAVLSQTAAGKLTWCGVTSNFTFLQSNWYYIELRAKANGASGIAELRVNGITDFGATTVNIGSTAMANIILDNAGGASGNLWDDLYIVDTAGASPRNAFLGDCRVYTKAASGTGANTAWTASAGTAWQTIDEQAANGDTDYIYSATPGDKSTFTFGALPANVGTVFGVQVAHEVRKDDAGARTVATVIRQSGTDYIGATSAAIGTTYLTHSDIYNQDPTGTDWTVSTVDADEFGVKEVA